MFTTVRVHMNPKESCFSLEHNRNKSFREKEAHIDGTSNNFEVWSNLGVYNAYKEVFGDTIQAYNDKQKRGKNLTNLDPAEYRELKDVKRQVNVAYEELDDVQDKIDAKSEALEHAEQVIAQAEVKEKNLAVTIASKLDEAEQYYMARKEEADDLLRKAEETYQARLQEAELRFGHIVRAYKKISDELEFYKKRCWNVLAKKMSLTISDKMLERWMKKNKIVRNEKWVSVYDACAADISRLGLERAKDQYKAADALQKEVQRQLEFTEESSDTDEEDTGYASAE